MISKAKKKSLTIHFLGFEAWFKNIQLYFIKSLYLSLQKRLKSTRLGDQ